MLSLTDLSVTLDDGTAWSAKPKSWSTRRTVIGAGESGTGKSTLARALAGGQGRRQRQFPSRPQALRCRRSRKSSGTLRRATAHPGAAED